MNRPVARKSLVAGQNEVCTTVSRNGPAFAGPERPTIGKAAHDGAAWERLEFSGLQIPAPPFSRHACNMGAWAGLVNLAPEMIFAATVPTWSILGSAATDKKVVC